MIIDRHPPVRLFGLVPGLPEAFEPELAQLDRLLEDDAIFRRVKADMARRRPHSLTLGRPGTPVEVILRLLVVKRLYDWSYEEVERLVSDSLVYRYDPKASPDGLQGSEGTFSLCTFLYVDALARSGRLDEARLTFEKMLTYANHVGLFAEEIGPAGEALGNFPQAFTHLALISAAFNLDRQLG